MGGILSLIAVSVGLWNAFEPWPAIGWTTPNQHNKDFAEVEDFRTEWRCSEWAEELANYYQQVETGNDSQQLQDRIEKLRNRMDENACDRWEDY